MFIESRSEYVSRKVDAWRKDEQRTAELEGTKPDPGQMHLDGLDVKHGAEDWYDFWDGITPW